MRDALCLAAVFVAFGGHAVAPLCLADRPGRGRTAWRYAAPLLVVGGLLASLLLLDAHLEGAVAQGVAPLGQGRAGRVLVVGAAALLLSDLILMLGGDRISPAGWRITAGLGLAAAAAAAWLGEILRLGEGPATGGWPLAAAVLCRLLVSLAAGELIAPCRPALALGAAVALPVSGLLLPEVLAALALERGLGWTAGAAAVLLAAARWLPARLRRPALAAGVVLAALYFARLGLLSEELGRNPQPAPPLPASGLGGMTGPGSGVR